MRAAVHCGLVLLSATLALVAVSLASAAVPAGHSGKQPSDHIAGDPPPLEATADLAEGPQTPVPPEDGAPPGPASTEEEAAGPTETPEYPVPPEADAPPDPVAAGPPDAGAVTDSEEAPETPGAATGPTTSAAVKVSAPAPSAGYPKLAPAGPAEDAASTAGGDADAAPRAKARIASHDGFAACHGVAPSQRQSCDELLSRLSAAQIEACSEQLDPRCRAATVRFTIESACVDQPDPDACRDRLRSTPCFLDPLSSACNRFLVTREVKACRAESGEILSFRCRVVGGALELFCLEHQAAGIPVDTARCPQAGGGTEEDTSPGGRGGPGSSLASAAAGAGDSTLVGLSDPGARGDLGRPAAAREPRPETRRPLARTGLAVPALVGVGLVALAAGAGARRRASGRTNAHGA